MSANSAKRLNVFLCHAPNDSAVARQFNNRLKNLEWIESWFGPDRLIGGQPHWPTVERAINSADIVVLFLSSSSTKAEGTIQRELRAIEDRTLFMPEGEIFTIPIRLDDCSLPIRLDKQVTIEYFPDANKKTAYHRLLSSLRAAAQAQGIQTSSASTRRQVKPPVTPKQPLQIIPSKVKTFDGHSVYLVGKMEFVKIPAGPFFMGSDLENPLAYPDERPQLHEVIPYDYFMGRYPVTVAQYKMFVAWQQYEHEWVDDLSKKHNHPVTCITPKAAKDFCKWLNDLYGKELPSEMVFRLPLEVEWEKAARGEKAFEWPWGDKFNSTKCNSRENGKLGTSAVGLYSARGGDSPYGVSDMAGNVWEWTTTAFKKYPYYSNDGRESEKGGQTCVVRGGSFNDASKYTRNAYRYMNSGPILYYFQGFRVAIGPPLRLLLAKCAPYAVP